MYGSDGNDLIIGDNYYKRDTDMEIVEQDLVGGNDVLKGYGGADRIQGGFGDDFIDGGDGVDQLYGMFGDDLIYGGDEDDFIFGDDYAAGGTYG